MQASTLPETEARSSRFPSISRSWRERRQRVVAFLARPPGIHNVIRKRRSSDPTHAPTRPFRSHIVPALLAILLAGTLLGASAPQDSTRAAPAIELRLPADIVYMREGHADSAVTFSHSTHVMLAENRCTGCHPAVFPMLKRGPTPRHGTMNAGGSCGLCHDGKQAFGVKDASACASCHSGARKPQAEVAAAGAPADSAAAAAAPRTPKPHTYPASDASPGPVTFRHKTHASDAKGCAACHPKPFRMVATQPLPDGGMHEAQACGACHDGKKTFATDDDATCTKCHRESGAKP